MKKNILFALAFVLLVTLAGCSSSGSMKSNIQKSDTPINNTIDPNITYETVQISYDGTKLVPEINNLTAGKNYKFIIIPSSDGIGSMTNLTIPGIDENIYDIKKGQPITIVINNAKVGNYESICDNYKMYQGKIVIQ